VSFAVAALAGLVAAWPARPARNAMGWWAAGPGILGVVGMLLAPRLVAESGPTVLLVQPAFEQARKMEARDSWELFDESLELTRDGLERESEPVDLVAWGETILPGWLVEDGLAEAVAGGAQLAPWVGELDEHLVRSLARAERSRILPAVYDVLPVSTAFLAGAELFVARGDEVRRVNAVALWNGPDAPRQLSGKRHLVPGAETMVGLERLAPVRDGIRAVAGYVPDLLAAETAVVELRRAADPGAPPWRMGVSVCFDNAFEGPFREPMLAGPLDLHMVVSNEAWYLDSFEMDQMMAFSRILAISTGRSVIRAANGGISGGIGPDGRELGRITDGEGRSKNVRGTLVLGVPVPVRDADGNAPRPPWVRTARLWEGLWLGLPILLLALRRKRPAPQAASA
jgi:apolipoprotein N-acyltransferase